MYTNSIEQKIVPSGEKKQVREFAMEHFPRKAAYGIQMRTSWVRRSGGPVNLQTGQEAGPLEEEGLWQLARSG
jgi:hypothetical protein